jgi:trehalose 6-phosphate phosphatase
VGASVAGRASAQAATTVRTNDGMNDQGLLTRPAPLDLRASALFLDLDGTLASFAERPQDVGPIASRSSLLRTLGKKLDGRLAVISGRTIADVDRILDGAVTTVAGVHGLERRWPDGRIERPDPDPGLAVARAAFDALKTPNPGLLIEDKALSLAIHFRAAPQAHAQVLAAAQAIATETGLVIQNGELVVELRGLGPHKGDALNAFMRIPPFVGARPLFVGDDLTDEDGFSAALALGGEGVLVGPPRRTVARRSLDSVDAVIAWLGRSVSGEETA